MANPFKEAENRAKGKVKEEEVVVVPEVKQEKKAPVVKEAPAMPVTKENLLAGMLDEKPVGKSYGFYLDEEVVDALGKLAKQNKTSKSKALNTLLRNLLLEK